MKIASTRYSDVAFDLGTLMLRIGAGSLMFVNHGLNKLTNFGRLSSGFSNPLGLGSPATLSLVIFAEVFCSALVILGLFTRLACIPLVFSLAFAFFNVHHMNYSGGQGGGESALLFGICFLALLFTGAGRISMDRLIGK
jgi:putative oxidoreductase